MTYYKSTLLTKNNHKTIKGEKFGYVTYIMYMSPHKQNSKGVNICPHASAGCAAACLFNSGFGGMYNTVQRGRMNKTEWYLNNRVEFMNKLDKEIASCIKKHKDKDIVTFRLNGTSDIRWEKIKVREGKNIFELYPDVQFYDYTKNPKRFDIDLPANYHLTFSRDETNHDIAIELLKRGFNVAIVFNKIPKIYEGFKVINGDETDLRFKDKKSKRDKNGFIIGLKYKKITGKGANNREAFDSGFAIEI